MINKYLCLMFAIVISLTFISAVPQVIFTSVNLTIANSTYRIQGEGISAVDSYVCGTDYFKANIPITFSREIGENNTDVSILIRALSINNNVSNDWKQCITRLGQMDTNLTLCEQDRGYKNNFTICSIQLSTKDAQIQQLSGQITSTNLQLKDLQSNKTMLYGIIAALAFAAWHFWNKQRVKTVDSPLRGVPDNLRI